MQANKLADVFSDNNTHISCAGIIARHSTNTNDIREIALKGVDLSECREVLDMGCAFGFFSRALKGKLNSGARITGIDYWEGYHEHFTKSCREAGFKSEYYCKGIEKTREFNDGHFDLILCSYALHFFPYAIPEIARILDKSGRFVCITHVSTHMNEFMKFIKDCITSKRNSLYEYLPYEELIKEFSDANAPELLADWFEIEKKEYYLNSLKFEYEDFQSFLEYFRFKRSFFIPDDLSGDEELVEEITRSLAERVKSENELRISKSDVIYRCRRLK